MSALIISSWGNIVTFILRTDNCIEYTSVNRRMPANSGDTSPLSNCKNLGLNCDGCKQLSCVYSFVGLPRIGNSR